LIPLVVRLAVVVSLLRHSLGFAFEPSTWPGKARKKSNINQIAKTTQN
jgi:hypothetical protein